MLFFLFCFLLMEVGFVVWGGESQHMHDCTVDGSRAMKGGDDDVVHITQKEHTCRALWMVGGIRMGRKTGDTNTYSLRGNGRNQHEGGGDK